MSSTIRDVAREAGVSISTVSRVMNDSSPVSEEKKKAVTEAAEKLGYAPNPAARSLQNKKTGGIGVLLPYVSGEFFSELLNGLDHAAQQREHFLVISTSHRQPTEFTAAIRTMQKLVDGLVIMAPELDAQEAKSLLMTQTPVAFINTYLDGVPMVEHDEEGHMVDMLNFENFRGAYMLARHLLELGHRRIAQVSGPSDAGDAVERTQGFRAAMAEAGIPKSDTVVVEGDYTQEAGAEATKMILEMDPRPTAIMAANDYCAMGVMSTLHAAGVRIPAEMAVAGFDGITGTQYTVPPLTTVRVPVSEIGALAIDRLVAHLEGDDQETVVRRRELPVELVVRGSTVHGT